MVFMFLGVKRMPWRLVSGTAATLGSFGSSVFVTLFPALFMGGLVPWQGNLMA